MINNYLLVLQERPLDIFFHEINFHSTPIWIQAHGLPPNRMNKENVEQIGNLAEKFLNVDFTQDGPIGQPIFLCIRIKINLNKHVVLGFNYEKQNSKKQWVNLKFEKLSDLY